METLRELAAALYREHDPTTFFYRGRPYEVIRDDGGFVLSIELPFASRDEIALSRRADELLVDVGSWRRTLVLPRALVGAPTRGARFEDHRLMIRFGRPEPQDNGGNHG